MAGEETRDDGAPGEGIDERETLAPPIRDRPPPPGPALPLIRLDETDPASEFVRRDLIGEGTMGRVYLADQRSIGREVAVKIPRPGIGHAERVEALMREARVTGRLEHPQIVPIHGLACTPDGATVMVMKRVEGVSWRKVADGKAAMPASFVTADPIEGQLRILLAVCDAIDFAHRRGVLHRDIKLDNVMLGHFGEVYVLDWGLAVALTDDGTGHLPLASSITEPGGTPGYMAPEMAMGHGHRLGVHSDVYCLGALLHRLLVGAPRHTGRTLAQVLGAAARSAPFDYDPLDLPRPLTAICARATAAEPADRYPDVAALRRALADASEHLASARLVAEAARTLAELHAARAAGEADAVERAFGAARFALEHALRIWPANVDARQALDALLLDGAEDALAAGRVDHAARLLAAAGPELEERRAALAAAIAAEEDRRARQQRLSREFDLGVFSRRRGLLLFAFAALWSTNNLRRALDPPTVERLVLDQLWMIALVVTALVAARRWLWSTRINRRLSLLVPAIVATDTLARLVGWRLGLGPHPTTVIEIAADLIALIFISLVVDRRFALPLGTFAAGLAAALVAPHAAFICKALATFLGVTGVALLWIRARPGDPPPAPQPR
ncbi:MAG: serine/threonine protein kinase [Myxococcales bacterium]|nr:serine/threonine protein kinase [Myxococcales bacterium]